MHLKGKNAVILATNGFEQSELEVPMERLKQHGAIVHVAAPEPGEIRGWHKKNWGRSVKVDRTLEDVNVDDYDAVVLPGGQMNPDTLRTNANAIELIRGFFDRNKVVAAICHAPWLLIDAGIARGRKVTSYPSLKADLINAGAKWQDAEVVNDLGVVTSRHPGDLDAFCDKVIEEIAEGFHIRRSVAGSRDRRPDSMAP